MEVAGEGRLAVTFVSYLVSLDQVLVVVGEREEGVVLVELRFVYAADRPVS